MHPITDTKQVPTKYVTIKPSHTRKMVPSQAMGQSPQVNNNTVDPQLGCKSRGNVGVGTIAS